MWQHRSRPYIMYACVGDGSTETDMARFGSVCNATSKAKPTFAIP